MTGRRIALLLEYEGTAYHGSQQQPHLDTIEARMRAAMTELTGEDARLWFQGRTDAGAHAKGQVMAFETEAMLPERAFVHELNHRLPADIAVKAARELPEGFDVRRRARSRVYRYLLRTPESKSPLWRRMAWTCEEAPDIGLMRQAARELVGEHDFAAFAGKPDRETNTVRRMFRATVHGWRGLIGFTFEGTAFLPHQVRRTVGALVQVGLRRLDIATFRGYLRSGVYAQAEPAAPPQGLYLWRVRYDPPLFEGAR